MREGIPERSWFPEPDYRTVGNHQIHRTIILEPISEGYPEAGMVPFGLVVSYPHVFRVDVYKPELGIELEIKII